MSKRKIFTITMVALVAVTATPQTALAEDATHIIGGRRASGNNGEVWIDKCSASLISPTWVLTARHCLPGNYASLGSTSLNGGQRISVAQSLAAPSGDVALLKLSSPYNGRTLSYATSLPTEGSQITIRGWGKTAPGENGGVSPELKEAVMNFQGVSRGTAGYGGQDMALTSNGNGVAWKGDSGGPALFNGIIVGVASTSDANTSSNYATLEQTGNWIASTTGVQPVSLSGGSRAPQNPAPKPEPSPAPNPGGGYFGGGNGTGGNGAGGGNNGGSDDGLQPNPPTTPPSTPPGGGYGGSDGSPGGSGQPAPDGSDWVAIVKLILEFIQPLLK